MLRFLILMPLAITTTFIHAKGIDVGAIKATPRGMQTMIYFAVQAALDAASQDTPEITLQKISPQKADCAPEKMEKMTFVQAWSTCWGVPEFALGSRSMMPRPSTFEFKEGHIRELNFADPLVKCDSEKCVVEVTISKAHALVDLAITPWTLPQNFPDSSPSTNEGIPHDASYLVIPEFSILAESIKIHLEFDFHSESPEAFINFLPRRSGVRIHKISFGAGINHIVPSVFSSELDQHIQDNVARKVFYSMAFIFNWVSGIKNTILIMINKKVIELLSKRINEEIAAKTASVALPPPDPWLQDYISQQSFEQGTINLRTQFHDALVPKIEGDKALTIDIYREVKKYLRQVGEAAKSFKKLSDQFFISYLEGFKHDLRVCETHLQAKFSGNPNITDLMRRKNNIEKLINEIKSEIDSSIQHLEKRTEDKGTVHFYIYPNPNADNDNHHIFWKIASLSGQAKDRASGKQAEIAPTYNEKLYDFYVDIKLDAVNRALAYMQMGKNLNFAIPETAEDEKPKYFDENLAPEVDFETAPKISYSNANPHDRKSLHVEVEKLKVDPKNMVMKPVIALNTPLSIISAPNGVNVEIDARLKRSKNFAAFDKTNLIKQVKHRLKKITSVPTDILLDAIYKLFESTVNKALNGEYGIPDIALTEALVLPRFRIRHIEEYSDFIRVYFYFSTEAAKVEPPSVQVSGCELTTDQWNEKLKQPIWELFTPKNASRNERIAKKFQMPEWLRKGHIGDFVKHSGPQANDLLKNKFNVTVLVEQTTAQNLPAEDVKLQSRDRTNIFSLKQHIESRKNSAATYWDYSLFSSIFLADILFRLDDDGEIPFYGYRTENGTPFFDLKDMRDFSDIYMWFQKDPKGESNMILALTDAFKKTLPNFKISSPKAHLFIVLCVSKPKNKTVANAIKTLIKRNLTARDPEGKHLHLLLVSMREDGELKEFCKSLDNDKEIGVNVDTKSLEEVLTLGSNTITNAIYEHLD